MKHIWKVGDKAYIKNYAGKPNKDFMWEIDRIDERGFNCIIVPAECIGPRQQWDTSMLLPIKQ